MIMDFGKALSYLKKGEKVARKGWNGKGQFVYYIPADRYPAKTEAAKSIADEDGKVNYRAYLALKTAQGDVATWVPSISDVLAEDWVVVGKDAKKTDDDKPAEPVSKTVVHVDKDKGIVSIVGNDPEGICKAMDAIAELMGVDE